MQTEEIEKIGDPIKDRDRIIIIIFSHDLKSNWWGNIPEFPASFPTLYITDRVGFDA